MPPFGRPGYVDGPRMVTRCPLCRLCPCVSPSPLPVCPRAPWRGASLDHFRCPHDTRDREVVEGGWGDGRGYQAGASPSPACGLFIILPPFFVFLFSLRYISHLCVELKVTATERSAVMMALSAREALMISAYSFLVRVRVV